LLVLLDVGDLPVVRSEIVPFWRKRLFGQSMPWPRRRV